MESPVITTEGISLSIGDFSIFCSAKTKLSQEVLCLPDSFMAFAKSKDNKANLKFIVDESFHDNSGQEIFCAENFMRHRICKRADEGLDWTWFRDNGEPGIKLHVRDNWSTLVLSHYSTFPNYLKHECGCAFNYSMLAHDACVFHGVVMEYEGMGILVTARSGVGKTTHTLLWRDHENALILNGDRSLCRRINDKWYAYGMPWCGSSGEYINRRVPVSYIVQLVRGEKNCVKEVSSFDASMYLLERIFAPVWEPTLRENAIDYCEDMGCRIPLLRLSCRPDLESVDVLKKAIMSL